MSEIDRNEIQLFHELMEKDVSGNGKSVCWDGSKATMEEDPLDDSRILDGRSVITGTEKITIPLVFEVEYTNSLQDVVVENEDEEHYHIEAENFDVCIDLIDYETEKEKLDADSGFRIADKEVLSKHQTEYFKKYELYSGITHTRRGDYAGYSLIFDSELDDRAYRITCTGIGCINSIKFKAFFIMNHFEVLYE